MVSFSAVGLRRWGVISREAIEAAMTMSAAVVKIRNVKVSDMVCAFRYFYMAAAWFVPRGRYRATWFALLENGDSADDHVARWTIFTAILQLHSWLSGSE